MTLSPVTQAKLVAVLIAAYGLLGCESSSSSAGEQTPQVNAPAAISDQPSLVTVNAEAPPPPVSAESTNLPASAAAPSPVPGETPHPPVQLSPRLQEVVKLAQSGVADDVILAFIQNSAAPFNPTPDEILYLTDVGISDVVVTALVNHHGNQPVVAAQPPPAASGFVPPGQGPILQQPPPEGTYNPEPQVVYGNPPPIEYPAAPPVEDDYFYSSLAPYGAWVEVSDYGYCWQPTVAIVHHDWRPYCDRGQWIYTDCGWYWHSDYSWGWAPFHYGRWFNHPVRGWCWRPDSVWAPAWVAWRYTDSHCGWAPLPPGAHLHEHGGFTYYGAHVGVSFGFGLHHDAWTFVPAGHFHEPEVWKHRVPPAQNVALYRQSHVANNYTVQNNAIVNRGVPAERVPELRRAQEHTVAIRDLPQTGGSALRPDHLRQEGAQVVVYRPKPLATVPPPANKTAPITAVRSTPSNPGTPAAGTGISNRPGVAAPQTSPASSELLARTRPQSPTQTTPSTINRTQTMAPAPRPEVARPASPLPGTPQPQVAAPAPRATQPATAGTSAARPQPTAQTEITSTPQTYRVPNQASNPSWDQRPGTPSFQRAAPAQQQATPAFRQEVPRPTAPSTPAPSYPAPRVESAPVYRPAPSPSYSAPAVTRPAPSYPAPTYSAPAVQSRPAPAAPTYSAPVSRPAPQAAPAPSQAARSNGNKQN